MKAKTKINFQELKIQPNAKPLGYYIKRSQHLRQLIVAPIRPHHNIQNYKRMGNYFSDFSAAKFAADKCNLLSANMIEGMCRE